MSLVLRAFLRPRQARRVHRVYGYTVHRFASDKRFVQLTRNEKTNVTTMRLARPPVNALTVEMMSEIVDTVTELEQSKSAGLIVTSSLPGIFSGGLDIAAMYKPDPVQLTRLWSGIQDLWYKLYGAAIPTAVAINGTSPAAGCLIALCCDYRVMVAGQRHRIGLNETQLGVAIPTFVYKTLVNVIGHRRAEVALTAAKLYAPDEALAVGLIDEVAADEETAIARAEAFLASMAHVQLEPRVVTKQRMRGEVLDWMVANREREMKVYVEWIQSEAVQATLQAALDSLQKRR